MEPSTAGNSVVNSPATNRRLTIVDPYAKGQSTNKPDLGVTQWQFDRFHSDFLHNNTIFGGEYVDGWPKPLKDAFESVQYAKEFILKHGSWELFRKSMHEVIRSTQDINQAVCLGLGAYPPVGTPEAQARWVYQYAAFDVICGWIQQYKGNKIIRIFQDPEFTVSTKYLLRRLADGSHEHEVVRLGEAERRVNESTFVYAIHLIDSATCDAVLQEQNRFPGLYIGNKIDDITAVPGRIAKQVIEHTYMTGDSTPQQWMEDLRVRAQKFHHSYEKRHFYYPEVGKWIFECFSDTIVHRKLREREVPSTYEVRKIPELEILRAGGPDGESPPEVKDGGPPPSGGHEAPTNGNSGASMNEEPVAEPPFEGEASDVSGKESPPLDSKRLSTLNNPKTRKIAAGNSRFGMSRNGSIREGIKEGFKDGKKILRSVGRTMSLKGRKDQKRHDSSGDGGVGNGDSSGGV